MNVRIMLAAGLAIGLFAPALAADDKDKNADTTKVQEKKICRTEMVTGSLVAKRRICLTKAEWDKLADDTKIEVDKYTSHENGLAIPPTK